jgi:hypothetical protein
MMRAFRTGLQGGLIVFCASCAPAGVHAPAGDAVVVQYEHLRTCTGFLGGEGQFFVYRIVGIENAGEVPFTLQPSRLRFADGADDSAAPALMVPEFSDVEVAPASREETAELYLLQRDAPGQPPQGRMLLRYDEPGVGMVVVGETEPQYADARGCDDLNT